MKRIDENHAFNIHIACAVGIEKAIILKDFYGWCQLNLQNRKHIHSGKPWTYNSAKALGEKYPYMKPRTIGAYLDELERDGWIESGNYNETTFDRTKWYAIDFEKYDNAILSSIGEKLQMDPQETVNGDTENCQPYQLIPSHTSYLTSPVSPETPSEKEVSVAIHTEVVAYLNSVIGTKYKSTSAKTKKAIHARCEEGFTLDDFKTVIDDRARRWGSDEKMKEYLRPETLFSPKFEGYLNAATNAVSANTDDTLNDYELTAAEQSDYNDYIQYVHLKYMDLYRSECKILSKRDWRDYKNSLSMKGLPNLMTKEERKAVLVWTHERLNKDQQFRSRYDSVIECYYQRAKSVARNETAL